MGYSESVAQLLALGHELHDLPSSKFDLAQVRALAEALGHPERRFPAVLIAGTNGKGSTAATLAHILSSAGYRTGLYTSPHLLRVNERIRVLPPRGAAEEISEPEFAEMHDRVERAAQQLLAQGKLPHHPSFFEVLTAMAFEYFASAAVDIAVLEVGMGGRLDATNIVEPAVSVITDIALDHQRFLGNTIAEIAREKAGIIHANGVLVTLPQHPQANDVIGKVALERNARGVSAVPYMPSVSPNAMGRDAHQGVSGDGLTAVSTGHSYELEVLGKQITITPPLPGQHQLRNIALAIAAAVELNQHGFKVTPESIADGVRRTRWPGRFQRMEVREHEVVLDVAHNPAGAWALRAALKEHFDEQPFTLVFGAMRDKAIAEMADILFPLAQRVVAVAAENPRSATPAEIAAAGARTGADIAPAASVPAALAEALAAPPSLLVITGSIYVVGEALGALAQY